MEEISSDHVVLALKELFGEQRSNRAIYELADYIIDSTKSEDFDRTKGIPIILSFELGKLEV